MRKMKIILAVVLLLGAATFTSCQKCMECEFEGNHGNHTHDKLERKCGNSAELKEFEAEMVAEALADSATVHCHESH
jgi:hypothetical protein